MPRKTDGEKIDDLEKLAATLVVRVDSVRNELDDIGGGVSELRKSLAATATNVAVLERDVKETSTNLDRLKKELEESSRKRWSLLPPVVGAIVSAGISALTAYLVANR